MSIKPTKNLSLSMKYFTLNDKISLYYSIKICMNIKNLDKFSKISNFRQSKAGKLRRIFFWNVIPL